MGSEMARLDDPTPPRTPFLPPEAPLPRPPADPRFAQRGPAGLILAILSLIAMLFIGNLQRGATVAAVALVVALVALALVIPALRAAKRGRTLRPRGALGGLVLGLVGALFSGSALIGFTVFGPQVDAYGRCLDAATTSSQHQACQTQLENAIDKRVGASR
jgi:hypothetical protein